MTVAVSSSSSSDAQTQPVEFDHAIIYVNKIKVTATLDPAGIVTVWSTDVKEVRIIIFKKLKPDGNKNVLKTFQKHDFC